MPIYEYQCSKCDNEFEQLMSLEEYSPIRVCPECNTPSTRKLSAPQLQSIKEAERIARERNERAIHEPIKITKQHECGHNHSDQTDNKQAGVYQQISQGTRPWMLG
ncbi:MAG: zinc ribbon domain-containing protein [Gammaproteobacteria bacterium]|nr:zinc ribbon domain-containing protein [Gammaproteobacteria bacterium]